jgi:hypothetical protein
MLVV